MKRFAIPLSQGGKDQLRLDFIIDELVANALDSMLKLQQQTLSLPLPIELKAIIELTTNMFRFTLKDSGVGFNHLNQGQSQKLKHTLQYYNSLNVETGLNRVYKVVKLLNGRAKVKKRKKAGSAVTIEVAVGGTKHGARL